MATAHLAFLTHTASPHMEEEAFPAVLVVVTRQLVALEADTISFVINWVL